MSEAKRFLIDETSTFIDDYSSDSDLSSDGLEIDISESPNKKEIDIEDKQVLENIEEEIERQYDEKAAKSNLTAINVKNILKHVITNEHVWAMVRNSTDENTDAEQAFYEPKLTRAKAKELLKTQNVSAAAIPWAANPLPKSEVHILINEELPEDSDDDEYVPHEEESEDEKESFKSDLESQPATPATPTSTHDNSTQTTWTEDGVFKVPPSPAVPKTPNHESEQENIALRTRSKLSLSDTPLEIIEEAFIPPDITTDMYDLECDDEDWKDFLKKFTRPLDEAVTGQDDDEADPEYNILSDEELDKLDKEEELRMDKGVKITKKELNTLISELLEFSEMFENVKGLENQPDTGQNQDTQENFNQDQSFSETPNLITSTPQTFSESQNFTENNPSFQGNTSENFEETNTKNQENNTSQTLNETFASQKTEYCSPPQPESKLCVIKDRRIIMTQDQLRLLEQQMRQHVQMLTQNFILCYKNKYLEDLAQSFKNMLLSLDEIAKYKTKTTFRPHNLGHCVNFLKDWEVMIASDTKEVRNMLTHLLKQSVKHNSPRETIREYFLTFPELLLKKVSQSQAFIYPALLPKIPFRYFRGNTKPIYVNGENELIALGLEQFVQYLKANLLYKTRNGVPSKAVVFSFISKYMMPHRDPQSLNFHIQRMRYAKDPNPINHYYKHKKAPIATHYVHPLEQFGCVPPCERPADMLPIQWKHFVYPDTKPFSEIKVVIKEPKPPTIKRRRPRKPKGKTVLKSKSKGDDSGTKTKNSSPSQPLLVINNFIPLNRKPVPIAPKPADGIHLVLPHPNQNINTSQKESSLSKDQEQQKTPKTIKKQISNEPKVEQIFIKTEDYYICNTTEIRPNLSDLNSVDSEPPPISTTEQIKKFTPDLLNLKFNSSIFSKVKDLDMLPSMPFLQTPVKDKNNDPEIEIEEEDPLRIETKIEEAEAKIEETETKIEETKSSEENESNEVKKDDEDELNALMIASSTIQKSKRLQPNLTKKAKQMREYNATLAMVCPESDDVKEEKAKNFAQAYYDKVQERLEAESHSEYQKFVEVLSEHDETKSTVSDLYEKVSGVLSPKHVDLCEEFLTFLTPEQAQQIGKLVPHFMLSNMSLFLRKLEIYYNNQPAQLRRIYNSLTELAETENVTMEKVKSTILPLLKGNALLIDWFLQMFPQEPPTESMLTDWEQIGEDDDQDDNKFETLTLPEVEDPYGGPNCICQCHKLDDEMYKTRARHCVPCGTKFMQGRVYVQTGKGLRLANVTFNSPNRIQQLSVKPTTRPKRKSETSPSKIMMSPTKDPEPHNSNESEDDGDNPNKKLKKFRTNSPPKSRKKPAQKTPKTKKETKTKKSETKKTKKPKKESEEMDTCGEESSQDTLEETDDSLESETENSEDSNSPLETEISECHNWTRDEDRIILESFQKCDQGQNVYKYIQKLLPGRKEQEIKQRFHILINLVREMSCEN